LETLGGGEMKVILQPEVTRGTSDDDFKIVLFGNPASLRRDIKRKGGSVQGHGNGSRFAGLKKNFREAL